MATRFFDILLASAALLFLSPLTVPLSILLRLTGEGEIFYFQDRVGEGGNNFKIYKFATMLKDSPHLGNGTITIKNDERILPVGKFLRLIKINELPQLINILFGEMSVIGHRPLIREAYDGYSEEFKIALNASRPGLSGVGSIVFRHEDEILAKVNDPKDFYNNSILPYKEMLERWYIDEKSLSLYFKLIFLTIWGILSLRTVNIFAWLPTLPKPDAELRKVIFQNEDLEYDA
ncbi:sugar transferase [Gammaproteobacteria bacterium]|nr:sugar transferase [Gammaproteobacteria bacterium]